MKTATKKTETKKVETPATTKKDELIFPKGIAIFNPHAKAPESIIGEIFIDIDKLTEFISENGELLHESEKFGSQLKITIRNSKEDKPYLTVNTFGLNKD